MRYQMIWVPEPQLAFRYGQTMEDPRDGLTLFGPLEETHPPAIRYGVVGTETGVQKFREWVEALQKPIFSQDGRSRPFFPGFEAAFRCEMLSVPYKTKLVNERELNRRVHQADPYQRVYDTVDLFEEPILEAEDDDERVDLWFVVIPDVVYDLCRPQSKVKKDLQVIPERPQTVELAERFKREVPLFDADIELETARAYEYQVHFHNQLKARLLSRRIATQIVRESTIDYRPRGGPRPAADLRSSIAWNLSTAAYYKSGGRPWKLANVRQGVCYVGLVFKRTHGMDPSNACCAAQMFLDSGDGVVFKGAVGPWYDEETHQYHLQDQYAAELVSIVLASYRERTNTNPRELFIHGRIRFSDEEWQGFKKAAGDNTKLVGVRIRPTDDLKVFRSSRYPLLRGMAYIRDERTAYLWTRGFIPRLGTYPGFEVPNPLLVDVCRGDADIEVILKDILALTKLNYNACIFGDGVPVTLRFADSVGEILTAGPTDQGVPLPFRYYI